MTRARAGMGIAVALIALLVFCLSSAPPLGLTLVLGAGGPSARPVVALLSDFGLEGDAVGLCHGAILRVNRAIAIVDLTHNIAPYNVQQAALALARTEGFPKGTVFVAVVDPGVGGERKALALRTNAGLVYVGPDNGIFTYVMQRQGVKDVVALFPHKINPTWKPGTFDGRDLFSPAGAVIATAGGEIRGLGLPVDPNALVRLPTPMPSLDQAKKSARGVYLATDHPYGNVWTNIPLALLDALGIKRGDALIATFKTAAGETRIEAPFVLSFADVPEGAALAYLNSDNQLAFALNQGDFAKRHRLVEGAELRVERKE